MPESQRFFPLRPSLSGESRLWGPNQMTIFTSCICNVSLISCANICFFGRCIYTLATWIKSKQHYGSLWSRFSQSILMYIISITFSSFHIFCASKYRRHWSQILFPWYTWCCFPITLKTDPIRNVKKVNQCSSFNLFQIQILNSDHQGYVGESNKNLTSKRSVGSPCWSSTELSAGGAKRDVENTPKGTCLICILAPQSR